MSVHECQVESSTVRVFELTFVSICHVWFPIFSPTTRINLRTLIGVLNIN
jgi:hypothetical protein